MLEVNKGFYGVSFFDEKKREYLLYNFEEVEGRLFLKEAIHRDYAGDSVKPSAATAYRFKIDGSVTIVMCRPVTTKRKEPEVVSWLGRMCELR